MRVMVFLVVCFALTRVAAAHRLDEYLQAATLDVGRERVGVELRMTPGVAVSGQVLKEMNGNGDGVISDVEQRAYVERVRGDLLMTVDGKAVALRPVSFSFPKVEEMSQGVGEIVLGFEAVVGSGEGSRRIVFENHHDAGISAYLVNCLMPGDAGIRITGQTRSYDQGEYVVEYAVGSGAATGGAGWVKENGGGSLFEACFYRGGMHILTGYDHLLFVTALVLAARTLWELVKVVSAFTLAHTLTLTLAAMGWVHLPERVVEPLIAGSILFVALQNVLWPRKASGWGRMGAAFFFGLFHGLGFAGGWLAAMREMPSGTMFVAIAAFRVGVEAGHQMVVLPAFGVLKGVRGVQRDVVVRTRVSMMVQRVGSAGISVAGAYYLCVALAGGG